VGKGERNGGMLEAFGGETRGRGIVNPKIQGKGLGGGNGGKQATEMEGVGGSLLR